MTERLYYDHAYLKEFDARVLACQACGEHYRVLLNQSAFYPTSGGQPFDTGLLGGVRVLDVNVENGEVWHTVSGPLAEGTVVHGMIDWQRRFDHMQQHAADHMIAGALHRMMGGVTIGLHISEEVSTIDVAMPEGVTRITDEWIRKIELDVNERIQKNVAIRCWFPLPDELKELPLRKEPTVNEHVRIVAIGDDEMVACGGTHPSSAGQIGLVKIISVTPARGKMRVAFLAGQRALKHYFECFASAHHAAALLSSPLNHLPASVSAMQEKLKTAEFELQQLKKERIFADIQSMMENAEVLSNGTKLVARFVEADAGLLKELTSKVIEKPGVIALMGTMNGEQAMYAFGRSADVNMNVGNLLRESARDLGGKGGGKPEFAQGGGSAAILEAAVQKIKTIL